MIESYSIQPKPLPRIPFNTANKENIMPAVVVPPLPRRPTQKNSAALKENRPPSTQTAASSANNLPVPSFPSRSSLPVPLVRSPFSSPVRANSLPHAPKVPPRDKKLNKSSNFNQTPQILTNHANGKNHQKLLPKNNNHSAKQTFKHKLPTHQTHKLLPKCSKPIVNSKGFKIHNSSNNTLKNSDPNLSDEMIKMISEKERDMFDYHAAMTNSVNFAQQPQKLKNVKAGENKTMEQVFCQKCNLLLRRSVDDEITSPSPRSIASKCASFIRCCLLIDLFKNCLRRTTSRNRYSNKLENSGRNSCKEFDSTSFGCVQNDFCSCSVTEGIL